MRDQMIELLLNTLLRLITPDILKKVVDGVLEMIEAEIVDSENEYDDKVILPLITVIREAFDLEESFIQGE